MEHQFTTAQHCQLRGPMRIHGRAVVSGCCQARRAGRTVVASACAGLAQRGMEMYAMLRSVCVLGLAMVLAGVAAPSHAETVLITGANQGIGLEFARQYAARGWTVIASEIVWVWLPALALLLLAKFTFNRK